MRCLIHGFVGQKVTAALSQQDTGRYSWCLVIRKEFPHVLRELCGNGSRMINRSKPLAGLGSPFSNNLFRKRK